MLNQEFNKILGETLGEYSFTKVKNGYYLENNELIIVISPQKSNFSDAFYINFGFLVKILHEGIKFPKDNQCDISARFHLYLHDDDFNENTLFELVNLSKEKLIYAIKRNVEEKIVPIVNTSINKYFDIYPNAKKYATLKLKEYMGID